MKIATKNTFFKKGMLLYIPSEGDTVLLCLSDSDKEGDTRILKLSGGGDQWDNGNLSWLFHSDIVRGAIGTVYFHNEIDFLGAVLDVFDDIRNNRGPLCS